MIYTFSTIKGKIKVLIFNHSLKEVNMNKNINMDRVVNAIEKLEAINGEPEYVVLKKQIASLERELTIFKNAMKQKLKFKKTKWGLVVPNDTILKQWQKENLLLEEVYKNKSNQIEVNFKIDNQTSIDFNAYKRKAMNSTVVFSGIKLNKEQS
jgi:hypothetical protein